MAGRSWTASESKFVLSVAALAVAGKSQTVSAEGGFHFGEDVSPSLFNAVAEQV